MSKVLNREKIQDALDDAADLSSSRASQLGGLRPEVGMENIALRVRDEVRIATLNWATVEAFNARVEWLQDRLEPESAWRPAKFAVKALVRDVISALMRVTDHANDLESLCRIVALTKGFDPASLSLRTGARESVIFDSLAYLRQRVPSNWAAVGNPPKLNNPELFELRQTFRPIRDGLLSHAKNYSGLDLKNDIPKIRQFLTVVSRLSYTTCQIFNLPSNDPDEEWAAAFIEATRFWEIVEGSATDRTNAG